MSVWTTETDSTWQPATDSSYFTVEDVMLYAIHAGCFPDLPGVKSAWDRLRKFGDGLCPFPQTELPGAWQDYRS